jgi:hypothetical protein
MLMIKERLLSVWLGYKRLTELSFPRRFPIVQFPNLPLIVAFLASAAGKFLRSVRDFARKEWPLRGSLADVSCHGVLRSAGG